MELLKQVSINKPFLFFIIYLAKLIFPVGGNPKNARRSEAGFSLGAFSGRMFFHGFYNNYFLYLLTFFQKICHPEFISGSFHG